ncbi:MAG: chemotaxis response regulator protein-glutamate methylesterase [Bryobacterales bacterium]|nr:chemotaxis response regulator protein-glutamate methylesterase [Bryobacterales bacterium]
MPKGQRIRVLIVDDSVVIRRLVSHALEAYPFIEVIGVAGNGAAAIEKIRQSKPDVVTLDIEMPEMDGLTALKKIRREFPDVRVVMFSTLTERGVAVTFEALALGADDYVTKASNEGSLDQSMQRLRQELVPKLKQFFVLASDPAPATPAPARSAGQSTITNVVNRTPRPVYSRIIPEAVAIGVSTGGPAALAQLVPDFPADFPQPILIVQHMPALFTRLLAERLNTASRLKVKEATNGEMVESATAYIAPGDFHMRVVRAGTQYRIALDQGPPQNSCRPAVDVLFESMAQAYGGAVTAVVLTGMGHDGARGAGLLKAKGAHVIAQDEASSVVWGMPGAVVEGEFADAVLPLDRIAAAVMLRAPSLARTRH